MRAPCAKLTEQNWSNSIPIQQTQTLSSLYRSPWHLSFIVLVRYWSQTQVALLIHVCRPWISTSLFDCRAIKANFDHTYRAQGRGGSGGPGLEVDSQASNFAGVFCLAAVGVPVCVWRQYPWRRSLLLVRSMVAFFSVKIPFFPSSVLTFFLCLLSFHCERIMDEKSFKINC